MKIGILGGTFDPIHLGHTHIACEIAQVLGLSKVVFMVSKYPPHKKPKEISPAFHRYAMVVLATMNEAHLYASELELLRSGPSYTFDTLEELSTRYPEDQFCFIAGTDSLRELKMWYEYDKLLSRHCMVFVQRPGAEVELDRLEISADLRRSIQLVQDKGALEIQAGQSFCLNLDAPPISSTEIRRLVASDQNASQEFLSFPVYQYIRKYRLYEEDQDLT